MPPCRYRQLLAAGGAANSLWNGTDAARRWNCGNLTAPGHGLWCFPNVQQVVQVFFFQCQETLSSDTVVAGQAATAAPLKKELHAFTHLFIEL